MRVDFISLFVYNKYIIKIKEKRHERIFRYCFKDLWI